VSDLRSRLIRLAHSRPDLRPHLLPLVAGRNVVVMDVDPKFYFEVGIVTPRREAHRVRFMFSRTGTERQGVDYVNANLSAPLEKDLAEHLLEKWNRRVNRAGYEPGDKYVGPNEATFLRGSLLRDATKAAQVAGTRAGAARVTLMAILLSTR
jgi:hypothetical protein